MTTIDMNDTVPPAPAAPPKRLRRTRTGRVAAGVSSGLGEYFGVDPVLFRVLFATSAFFGGAGILAYLLAWAAIPEEGTERAPIDGWVGALRRRRVPLWAVAVVGGLLLWVVAFSWWAPGPFVPVVAVVVILAVVFGRRDLQSGRPAAPEPVHPAPGDATVPVDLTKPSDAGAPATGGPTWPDELRTWYGEAREASRRRRRRALPVKIGTLGGLGATLVVLAIADAVAGIPFVAYFWTTLGFVVVGLLVGVVLRRTPWTVATLLVPALLGVIAFAGSRASLHDGIGDHRWTPVSAPRDDYRIMFGRGVLDLRSLSTQDGPRRIEVTAGAGRVDVIAPRSMRLTVHADVHLGAIALDGRDPRHADGGVGIERTIVPPAGATGRGITVVVRLADGLLTVDRR